MLFLLKVVLVSILACTSVWAESPRDSEANELAKGKLLVAMPQLQSPSFRETVVLLVDYGRQGAMGLVLNRPTALSLDEAFTDIQGAASQKLFFGGPVQSGRNLMLVAGAEPRTGSAEIMGGLYLLHVPDDVRQALSGDKAEGPFRVFSGYAGWGPHQLEHEIYRGDWLVLPANPTLVMETEPDALWPRLIRYSHSQVARR